MVLVTSMPMLSEGRLEARIANLEDKLEDTFQVDRQHSCKLAGRSRQPELPIPITCDDWCDA